MRTRRAALVLAAALTACTPASLPAKPSLPAFSIQPYESGSSPAPLLEVRAGYVRSVYPKAWDAKLLTGASVPREGFVASPRLDRFQRSAGTVQGMQVFWIDIAKVRIPSDYYYLAARNEAISALHANKTCRSATRRVFADHPPAFTGPAFSPGDYVVSGSGTCRTGRRATRWAYVVAAPGFGPAREVGIPNSGLYVVMAVVSGPNSQRLLNEMIQGSRFGGSSITQIVRVAGQGGRAV